jgi:small subunit ribosomal protein S17e
MVMGRIKTKPIKRVTEELIGNHFDEFTGNFNDNKAIVDKHTILQSKKLRNTITGYVTRIVRSREV